jgi:hypothetical protein
LRGVHGVDQGERTIKTADKELPQLVADRSSA